MAISYVNTNEVEDANKDFKNLVNQFNEQINDLYKRLSEVPTISREWFGNQANYYFRVVNQDKRQYNNFVNKLNLFSLRVDRDLEKIENVIKNNTAEESRKD